MSGHILRSSSETSGLRAAVRKEAGFDPRGRCGLRSNRAWPRGRKGGSPSVVRIEGKSSWDRF